MDIIHQSPHRSRVLDVRSLPDGLYTHSDAQPLRGSKPQPHRPRRCLLNPPHRPRDYPMAHSLPRSPQRLRFRWYQLVNSNQKGINPNLQTYKCPSAHPWRALNVPEVRNMRPLPYPTLSQHPYLNRKYPTLHALKPHISREKHPPISQSYQPSTILFPKSTSETN